MTTNYTKINKAAGTGYTNVNAQGKEQYDQALLTYDDSSTFYDGINQSLYTSIPKASGTSYTKILKAT